MENEEAQKEIEKKAKEFVIEMRKEGKIFVNEDGIFADVNFLIAHFHNSIAMLILMMSTLGKGEKAVTESKIAIELVQFLEEISKAAKIPEEEQNENGKN